MTVVVLFLIVAVASGLAMLVLVSSGIHMRRSALYFSHFGVHPATVRSDYVGALMSPLPLAYNFLLTDLAPHEYVGLLRYQLFQLLGWNINARHPGAP
jgi:uncharacterized SAM-binding protein YcdF (DUF218 family)